MNKTLAALLLFIGWALVLILSFVLAGYTVIPAVTLSKPAVFVASLVIFVASIAVRIIDAFFAKRHTSATGV